MPIYKSTLSEKDKERLNKIHSDKNNKSQVKKNLKLPIILCSIFVVLFISLFIPGKYNFIKSFILGCFGLFSYSAFAMGIVFSIVYMTKRNLKINKKYVIILSLILFMIIFISHLIVTNNLNGEVSNISFWKYIADTYKMKTSIGGAILAIIIYPLLFLLKSRILLFIFSGIALLILSALLYDFIKSSKKPAEPNKVSDDYIELNSFGEITSKSENENIPITIEAEKKKLEKSIAKQMLGLDNYDSSIIASNMPITDIDNHIQKSRPMTKREYILTPPEIEIAPVVETPKKRKIWDFESGKEIKDKVEEISPSEVETNKTITSLDNTETQVYDNEGSDNSYKHDNNWADDVEKDYIDYDEDVDYSKDDDTQSATSFEYSNDYLNNIIKNANENLSNINLESVNENSSNINLESVNENLYNNAYDSKNENSTINSNNDKNEIFTSSQEKEIISSTSIKENKINSVGQELIPHSDALGIDENLKKEVTLNPRLAELKERLHNIKNTNNERTQEETTNKVDAEPKRPIVYAPYIKPPIELLNLVEKEPAVTEEECLENIERLEKVLADFKVPAKVINVKVGPAVTRYELSMPQGISVKKISMISDDIAMTLASNGSVRIEAPIPGKNAVGIEVPNNKVTMVSLRETMETNEYLTRVNPLSFILGKDINGDVQFCNLDKMPHMLVAGSTGSGKSVCLNTMLLSLICKSGPEDLRIILIDPKMVEFSLYEKLPHLLTPKILTSKEQALEALNWAIKEMDRRYLLLQKYRVVNIKDYNNLPDVKNKLIEKLPFILIVVDEFGDLMIDSRRDLEDKIMKITQKARAAGIHLVIATQRPSVDVITGTIKANLPSRISFALTNYADSKTVLDQGGAEKLLGKGDMLFKPNGLPEPKRVQGAFVTSEEVSRICDFIREHNPCIYDKSIEDEMNKKQTPTEVKNDDEINLDPILKDVLKYFITINQASISMIQRRFGVGYTRAARIVDQMEDNGFISASDGQKPRQILITMDDWKNLFE